KPWTHLAYQLAMDHYFKILCAHEEIKWLNVEIHQVVTWIHDENQFLRKMEVILWDGEGKSEKEKEDEYMAVQVCLYRQCHGHFNMGHMQHFCGLAHTPGFMGSLTCRVAVEHQELWEHLQELCM
ncbi:hypothetical protein DFH08DRAFT_719371, partial [Mycena albidolilacea]